MIDTHAHLDFESFNADREEVIERFFKTGGKAIIGVDRERIEKTLEISESHERIFSVIGFHPEEGEKVSVKEAVSFLENNLESPKVLAVGEIGLDYFHNSKNKENQKELFVAQFRLAVARELPVVIHCRDAHNDLIDLLSSEEFSGKKFVIHCYGGSLEQTRKFLEFPNCYFSFTGNITYPQKSSSELFESIKLIPAEKIMVETDCPFLAPQSRRGSRCEPVFVKEVIEKIAEIKDLSFEETEKITDQNAERFFGIDFG